MSKFTIPTPQENNYFNENPTSKDALLNAVSACIENKIYTFRDEYRFESYENLNAVNLELSQFGWMIERSWRGSKDDGYSVIEIKPKQENNECVVALTKKYQNNI